MSDDKNNKKPKNWKMLAAIIVVPVLILLIGFGVMASWNAQRAPHEVDESTKKTVLAIANKIMGEATNKGVDPAVVGATSDKLESTGALAKDRVDADRSISLYDLDTGKTLLSVAISSDNADISVTTQADGVGFTVTGYNPQGKVQHYHWHSDNYDPSPEVNKGRG